MKLNNFPKVRTPIKHEASTIYAVCLTPGIIRHYTASLANPSLQAI